MNKTLKQGELDDVKYIYSRAPEIHNQAVLLRKKLIENLASIQQGLPSGISESDDKNSIHDFVVETSLGVVLVRFDWIMIEENLYGAFKFFTKRLSADGEFQQKLVFSFAFDHYSYHLGNGVATYSDQEKIADGGLARAVIGGLVLNLIDSLEKHTFKSPKLD